MIVQISTVWSARQTSPRAVVDDLHVTSRLYTIILFKTATEKDGYSILLSYFRDKTRKLIGMNMYARLCVYVRACMCACVCSTLANVYQLVYGLAQSNANLLYKKTYMSYDVECCFTPLDD